jgi:hypothetical protein
MRGFWVRSVVYSVAVLLCGSSHAGTYDAQVFARPGDVFQGHSIAFLPSEEEIFAINNQREVVFLAAIDETSRFALLTQHRILVDGATVVDGVVPFVTGEGFGVDINDHGTVVFGGFIQDGAAVSAAVFEDRHLVAKEGDKIEGQPLTAINSYPRVTSDGESVFTGTLDFSGEVSVVRGLEVVHDIPQMLGSRELSILGVSDINEHDVAAFGANAYGTEGWRRIYFTKDGQYLEEGQQFQAGAVREFYGDVHLSPTGRLTATTWLSDSSQSVGQRYIVSSEDILVAPGDVVGGLEIVSPGRSRWTADGTLIFDATYLDSRGYERHGLFSSRELIVAQGSLIGSDEVLDGFYNFATNGRGDVVFLTQFTSGEFALVLATVPEPSAAVGTFALLATLGAVRRIRYAPADRKVSYDQA